MLSCVNSNSLYKMVGLANAQNSQRNYTRTGHFATTLVLKMESLLKANKLLSRKLFIMICGINYTITAINESRKHNSLHLLGHPFCTRSLSSDKIASFSVAYFSVWSISSDHLTAWMVLSISMWFP